jgi:hypothetical protein
MHGCQGMKDRVLDEQKWGAIDFCYRHTVEELKRYNMVLSHGRRQAIVREG